MRRFAQIVFAVAAVVWAVLIWKAAGNPERETSGAARARTAALIVAFAAGAFSFPQRRG